ncbi:glycosyltransferase family 4 protein [uncultured Parabacteroides sp.]|uniref:MraY family glycosyltransferase n=1 Tax=uncultured Parabacteroides sp. TaxID=512312 RepID=UPI002583F8B9|nr:glycosyltransferase family 4 protein [uncultured Parabacteroides sp.]
MLIYILLFFTLLLAELLYFRIADKFNIIDKPNERSSHKRIVLRGGGIIFLIGVWIWSVIFRFQYPWFWVGLTLVALVSFIDDIRSLPDSVRLIVQFVAMFLMFYQFGILNWQSWWIILLALIVCVGISNAYNFMDGINGITGGYSIAVLLPLIFLNHKMSFIDANFLWVTLLSLLVFCFFNFRKRAKCFAGDVGSLSIAFIIVFALGKLILQTGDFTYIVFLALYGVDSVLTICHRILLHENLGQAHRKHAYQLMANELKIPHVVVSSFYMIVQLLVSFGMVLLSMNHWLYLVTVLVVLCEGYLFFMKRYYHLHEAYLRSLNN